MTRSAAFPEGCATVARSEAGKRVPDRLPCDDYRRVLQVSAAHVYLTCPFVLSWSLLAARPTGCRVIGSRTAPVEEVIRDGENGVLVDFFDVEGIVGRVLEALETRARCVAFGDAARVSVKRIDAAETGRGYQSVVMPDSRGRNSLQGNEKGGPAHAKFCDCFD